MKKSRSAFTLIELLTVIAIIGVLASIIIPTVSSARNGAKRAKTRSQFAQWGAAIEAFRQEYGYYPVFDSTNLVNTRTLNLTNTAQHTFHDVLVGRRRDGTTALPRYTGGGNTTNPPPEAQNIRRIQFITFTEDDLFSNTPAAEFNALRNNIHDAFGDTDIGVLVDKNLDGIIKVGGTGSDYTAAQVPTVASFGGATRITLTTTGTTADLPASGVRAGVIFFSAPPGATTSADLIKSW